MSRFSLRFWLYTIRAMWQMQMGRWYVWRDVPTDVVRQMACLWYASRNSEEAGVRNLVHQAREEYKLRKRRGEK